MQENSVRYIEEDEIDLRELFRTLLKKKKFIIVFTTVVTLLAVVYALLKTPIYEARALVEIGSYKLENNNNNNNNNNRENLDNASQLSKRLNVLFIDLVKKEKDKKAQISSIGVPKGAKDFLELKSDAVSNELASKEIINVLNYIQKEHQKILDDIKLKRELEVKNIDSKILSIKKSIIPALEKKIKYKEKVLSEIKAEIKEIDKNIKIVSKKNPALAGLKLMEKRDLMSFVITLNGELVDLQDKQDRITLDDIVKLQEQKMMISSLMLPHNYKNTAIVGDIILNDYPVKPKKKLIVVVAFVTGFILSIFLVFFMEFIRNEKEYIVNGEEK